MEAVEHICPMACTHVIESARSSHCHCNVAYSDSHGVGMELSFTSSTVGDNESHN